MVEVEAAQGVGCFPVPCVAIVGIGETVEVEVAAGRKWEKAGSVGGFSMLGLKMHKLLLGRNGLPRAWGLCLESLEVEMEAGLKTLKVEMEQQDGHTT